MKMASSSSSKDPDPCAICLEPVKQEAYLDCCFHTFCYPCIVYWSNTLRKKTEALSSIKCPLCKMEIFSIIHSFDGEYFQQHYISQVHTQNFLSSAHNFRLQWYKTDVRDSINAPNVKLYWKHHKYLRGNAWLESWLRREIQALTLEEDVDIIVHHILGVIESFVKREQGENMKNVLLPLEKRREFKGLVSDAARPFLSGRTERFVDEMEWFLMLGLNITAYDEICMQSFASRSACGE